MNIFNWLYKLYKSTLSLKDSYHPYTLLPKETATITTPFGSRVYGGAKKSSDVDLLADYENSKLIQSILSCNNIKFKVKKDMYTMTKETIEFTYKNYQYSISTVRDYSVESLTAKLLCVYASNVSTITTRKDRCNRHGSLAYLLTKGGIPDTYSDLAKRYAPELSV